MPGRWQAAGGGTVRGFLDALGMRPEQIPAGLDDQAGLYRSLLARCRILVVLDNAADDQQVRPLLPGSPGCLAVVTSRRQLTGLAAAEVAALITLDCLPEEEALQLLADRLGAGRVDAELDAASELVRLCGGLPLALAIAAARGAVRPAFSVAELAADLRKAGNRLNALDARAPGASIRPVFSWSCQALSQPAGRMFRLLGQHPGPDVSAPAASTGPQPAGSSTTTCTPAMPLPCCSTPAARVSWRSPWPAPASRPSTPKAISRRWPGSKQSTRSSSAVSASPPRSAAMRAPGYCPGADTLDRLGDAHAAAADLPAARNAWQQALDILDDLGHHDAERLQAKLASS